MVDKKLIHAAKCLPNQLLLLRQEDQNQFCWYIDNGTQEIKTEFTAPTIEEAIKLGRKKWKIHSFRTINCGFRYTLPERDEHGTNALFYQMAKSQSTMNGIYFDETVGHNCFVQAASREALDLLDRLQKENRL